MLNRTAVPLVDNMSVSISCRLIKVDLKSYSVLL
jgi:hypothetical protein